MADQSVIDYGESKHERCKFGRLTEAWQRSDLTGIEHPLCLPLCTFDPPGPVPPALTRVWGGLVEFDRDCAVCHAFKEL